MPGAVHSQFLAPATRDLEAFGWRVLTPEWRPRWVEWRAEESVNGKQVEGRVHERRPQHRRLQDRRPRMACAPRYRTFFFSASKKKQKRSATKASEPQNSQVAVARLCRRIVAGFSFALDSSTAGVRPQQCPGLSSCSCQLPLPEVEQPSVGVC